MNTKHFLFAYICIDLKNGWSQVEGLNKGGDFWKCLGSIIITYIVMLMQLVQQLNQCSQEDDLAEYQALLVRKTDI